MVINMTLKPILVALPALFMSAGIGFCQESPEFPPALLAPGEISSFSLTVEQGSYLRGRLISPGHPFDLILRDAEGQDVRQLLKDNTGAAQFHLIAPNSTPIFALRNTGTDSFAPQLEIEKIVTPSQMTGPAQTYLSPTMATLAEHLSQGGTSDAFWAKRAQEGTPMIEASKRPDHVIATFLWRGAKKNVRLWGGPASDHMWMAHLGDSDVWYVSVEMPKDARLSYGIAPDVPQFEGSARENRVALLASLQADPLNTTPIFSDASDIWAQRSMVEGPQAPEQPGMMDTGNVSQGTITPGILTSKTQPDRRVDFYRPAGFDPADPDTVLLVLFDGPAYQTDRAPVPRILDRLIAQGQLPQVVVALIDPVDGDQRGIDLTCNPEFADMLALEWLPQIEATFGITPTAKQRVVAGSSYGGLAAAYLTHRHPEIVGNAVVLSGSFWWVPDGYEGRGMPYMSALWAKETPPDVRLWMSAGIYEVGQEPGSASILETTRHLRDVLWLKGLPDVTYREYSGGHDYLVWRGALAEGLLHLFGTGN